MSRWVAALQGASFALTALLLGCSKTSAPPPPKPANGVAPIPTSAGVPPKPPPALPSALPSPTRPPAFEPGPTSVVSERGLVVAVEPLAAEAGARVLAQGGNAVDAAIATMFALCVTHPNAASLGGGGFALVHEPGQPTRAFDFRELAPLGLTRAAFDTMIATGARGAHAVGTPGTVAGLALLHERFASKPWAELIAPAVPLARDGHRLRPWQAQVLEWSRDVLARDPAARRIFAPRNQALRAGDAFVQRDLARSLERLALHGAADFYGGELARHLTDGLAPAGPSLEDLARYRAVERAPLRFTYRGYTIETMPPPSAGGVTLAGILLGLASQLPPAVAPGSVEEVHWFLEASRRAQAERRLSVVDPDSLPPAALESRLQRWLAPAFWAQVPIEPGRATPSARIHALYPALPSESEHTTHLSVVDASGMVVSLTTTLSASFGARVVAGQTGIVMNNAVASFGAAGDNQPTAGKRTVSSMAPTLVLRGDDVAAVLGTPGGDTIPSTLAQLVRNLIDRALPLDSAVNAPRWHHGFVPDLARYEPTPAPSAALVHSLMERGHRLRPFRRRVGDANCIVLKDGKAYGFADPREFGVAVVPPDAVASPSRSRPVSP